jgi:hypothetical protein
MPIQDQRPTGLLLGPMGRHNINGLIVIVRDRGKPGMARNVIRIDPPTINGVTPVTVSLKQKVLAGTLLTSGRRKANQCFGELQLGLESCVDRLQYRVALRA